LKEYNIKKELITTQKPPKNHPKTTQKQQAGDRR